MNELSIQEIQDEINEIDKQTKVLDTGIEETKDKKEKNALISKKKELAKEKEEYLLMLKEVAKEEVADEDTQTTQSTQSTQNTDTKYKGYFRSQDKMFACVLRPADVVYDNRGNKITKKAALVVKFKNFRYLPKTAEEKERLLKFSEKYPDEVKYISATSQIKRDELEEKKKQLENEIENKYSDVEKTETASIKRGLV